MRRTDQMDRAKVKVPLCLVMAHGRGLRLHGVSGGACKGLLALDHRTSILSNLLSACDATGLKPVVIARPEDHDLHRFAIGRPVVDAQPRGYIVDIADLAGAVDDVVILDCDTVAEPQALRSALRAMLHSTSECTVTVAAQPLSDDPRSIRPVISHGRIVDLSDSPSVPRTTGIYRFRGGALDDIRSFLARAGGTFHDFMGWYRDENRPMSVHTMDLAFNVNWPEDYEAARTWWSLVRDGHDERVDSSITAAKIPTA